MINEGYMHFQKLISTLKEEDIDRLTVFALSLNVPPAQSGSNDLCQKKQKTNQVKVCVFHQKTVR